MPNTRGGKTQDPELGRLCKEFNNNKTKEEFTRLCDLNPNYDNRVKCRCCGKDIFYRNVVLKGPFQEYPTINNGTSFLSTKTINGKKYKLTVCEDCLEHRFPEYKNISNKSRIFNMPTKYAQYAFEIPEGEVKYKLHELCVRSEEGFINKYGEIEGKKRWNQYIEKQRYTTTKEYFTKTYGDVEGTLKWLNFIESRDFTGPYSKISQELFNNLVKDDFFKGHSYQYAECGCEREIFTKSKHLYYLDFYDDTIKICIEFNGNAFHPKHGLYNETDVFTNPHNVSRLVKDMWNEEELRYKELKNEYGVETFVVWEDDYRTNKQKTMNDLIINIKKYYEQCI